MPVHTPDSYAGINVDAIILKPKVFTRQIIANGKVDAGARADLRFKKQDRISAIYVKNGDYVKAGTLLASLDNYMVKNQLEKAKLNLKKARWERKKMMIDFNIKDTTGTPAMDFINSKSGYYEALNNIANLQLQYDETLLKAPFSGIISNLTAKAGNFTTGNEPFCTLISKNNAEAVFYILDAELPLVKQGEKTEIIPFAFPGKKYKGVISEINPQVGENGMIRVKTAVFDKDDNLVYGMNVKVIINKKSKNTIVVPKSALVSRSGKEVVFTVSNGMAKWNYVKTTGENSEYYAIEKGLSIGDTVIISNNMNLSHDAKVKANIVTW